MKHIKFALAAIVAVLGLSMTPLLVSPVSAATPQEELCKGSGGTWSGGKCNNPNAGGVTVEGTFRNVVDLLLFLVGAISVIMIIVGGIRYAISGGDSSQVNSAKNTILYAIIGLIVAFVSYGIVMFVDRAF